MEIYITFGQNHTHRVNGVTFDKDTVARIKCKDKEEGKKLAFELFGDKFFTDYSYDQIQKSLEYFPRGIFNAN